MQYRRARVPGGTFFFTVVTHNRWNFLCSAENLEAMTIVTNSGPLIVLAKVNHLHLLPSVYVVRTILDTFGLAELFRTPSVSTGFTISATSPELFAVTDTR
jgi:hypothetical protein